MAPYDFGEVRVATNDFHPRLWDPLHCNKTCPPERKLAEKC